MQTIVQAQHQEIDTVQGDGRHLDAAHGHHFVSTGLLFNMHPSALETELGLVKVLHSAVPVLSALFFFIASCIQGSFTGLQKNVIRLAWRWRLAIVCLIVTVLFSYVRPY